MSDGVRLSAPLVGSLLLALAVYVLLPGCGALAPPADPESRPQVSPPAPPAPPSATVPEPAMAEHPRAPIPVPAPEEAPRGPSVEERLNERPDSLVIMAATSGHVLEGLALQLGLRVEFASDILFQTCMASRFRPVSFITVPLRDILDTAVRNVASPEEGKVVAWKVEKDLLVIHLEHSSHLSSETPEKAAKALRARLAEEKTSLELRGETVTGALVLVGRTHKVSFRPDPAIRDRLDVLHVDAALKGATLSEVFDEILRVDPDLAWEVQGHLVVIRKK